MWLEYKAGRQNGEVKKGIKTSKIKLSYFLKSTIILTLMMIFKKQVPLDASWDDLNYLILFSSKSKSNITKYSKLRLKDIEGSISNIK